MKKTLGFIWRGVLGIARLLFMGAVVIGVIMGPALLAENLNTYWMDVIAIIYYVFGGLALMLIFGNVIEQGFREEFK